MVFGTIGCKEAAGNNAALAHGYRILLVVTEPHHEQYLRTYADALAMSQSAQIVVLRDYRHPDDAASPWRIDLPLDHGRPVAAARAPRAGNGLDARIKEVAGSWPFDMLIARWPDTDEDVAAHVRIVKNMDVISVLVRLGTRAPRRVVVPAGGGAHALEGIRVADALAKAWSLDAQVLRIVQPSHDFWSHRADMKRQCHLIRDAARLYVDVADVSMPVKVRLGNDVADEIIRRSGPDDLIVIGGSSQWLMENHASASIPSRVAGGAAGPVMMVLTNRGRSSSLADVFWDGMVHVRLAAASKSEALEALVDALIDARQAPDRKSVV